MSFLAHSCAQLRHIVRQVPFYPPSILRGALSIRRFSPSLRLSDPSPPLLGSRLHSSIPPQQYQPRPRTDRFSDYDKRREEPLFALDDMVSAEQPGLAEQISKITTEIRLLKSVESVDEYLARLPPPLKRSLSVNFAALQTYSRLGAYGKGNTLWNRLIEYRVHLDGKFAAACLLDLAYSRKFARGIQFMRYLPTYLKVDRWLLNATGVYVTAGGQLEVIPIALRKLDLKVPADPAITLRLTKECNTRPEPSAEATLALYRCITETDHLGVNQEALFHLVEALSKLGRLQESVAVLNVYEKHNLTPDPNILRKLLHGCVERGDADLSDVVYSQVIKGNIEVDSDLRLVIARFLAISNRLPELMEILKQTPDSEKQRVWTAGITSAAKRVTATKAAELYFKAIDAGIVPDGTVITAITNSFGRASQFDQARHFLDTLRTRGITCKDDHFLGLISGLLRSGDIKRAAEVAEACTPKHVEAWLSILTALQSRPDLSIAEKALAAILAQNPTAKQIQFANSVVTIVRATTRSKTRSEPK